MMRPHRILIAMPLMTMLVMLAAPARADVIRDWNSLGDDLAAAVRLPPPPHARNQALMHVAMFEAVNAIERRYRPYRLDLRTERNTSTEAAAAVAAHAVLAALYPGNRAPVDALLAHTLDQVPEGPARQRALLLGRKAAADLLDLRADDGTDTLESWRPATPPGVYIPTVVPVGSTFGSIRPWVLKSASQLRPAPPLALTSEAWARDLNEIRELGGAVSRTRTAEQTVVAKFWFLNGPRTYDPLIQQVAQMKRLDLLDSARMYALASMAASDAYIAVFDAKYYFNFWRPMTAIRNADQTGNAATARDAHWLPLGETPMHPEYPCAHCISSAAVAAVLIGLAGDDFPDLTLTSSTAPGVTRHWKRLSHYREEVSLARIWAGFHYRFSTQVGKDMGRRIGELALTTQLLPAVEE